MTALWDPRPGRQTQGRQTQGRQTQGRQTQDRPLLRPVAGVRRRMATVPFVMVVAVILALGMVGLLVLTTALQDQTFGVQRTQRVANTLAIRLSALQDQVATARSVQNLSVTAQHLGMRPNPYGVQLRISDGAVIGDPKVVFGGEVPTVRYLTPEQAAAQVRALDRAEAERKAKAKAARAEAKAKAKAKAEARAKAKAEAEAAARAKAEAAAKAEAEAAAKAKKGGRP